MTSHHRGTWEIFGYGASRIAPTKYMKIQQRTIYHCDFCNKYRLRKLAMEKHELRCPNNPKNYRACYHCIHLQVGEKELLDHEPGGYVPSGTTVKTFFCTYFNKSLHGHMAEILELPTKYKKDFQGSQPMPMECEERETTHPDPWLEPEINLGWYKNIGDVTMKRELLVQQKQNIIEQIKLLQAKHRAIILAIRDIDYKRKSNKTHVCSTRGCHGLPSKRTSLSKLGTYYKLCD